MTDLNAKVAIVTGASGGIGSAIATKLAERGATIAVHYASTEEAADRVVSTIKDRGGDARAVHADLSSVAGVETLFQRVDELFGQLDIVVNNAGTIIPQPIAEATEDAYDQVFAINAKAVFFAMKEAARRMGSGGRIINITSANTHLWMPTSSAYSATKAAVHQFTRIGAHELGPQGVTVNAVSPGATNAGMMANAPEQVRQHMSQLAALGRMGEADEVAEVVAFLASHAARWITGQNIQAGGGLV